jgi:hypothetical protein
MYSFGSGVRQAVSAWLLATCGRTPVFTTALGIAMDAANVRGHFRRALRLLPALTPSDWTPRELSHSFVSLLSNAEVPIEQICSW